MVPALYETTVSLRSRKKQTVGFGTYTSYVLERNCTCCPDRYCLWFHSFETSGSNYENRFPSNDELVVLIKQCTEEKCFVLEISSVFFDAFLYVIRLTIFYRLVLPNVKTR